MATTKTNGTSNGVAAIPKRRRSRSEIKETVLHTDPTRDYQTTKFNYWGELFVQKLPQWRLMIGRMMLTSDPIVNFSLNVRNASLMPAEVIVKSKNERVRAWVQEQWDYLWNQHRSKMTSAKEFGFAPLQILAKEKQGLIIISGCKSFAQEDCRALTQGSRLVGMRVKGNPVMMPQMLWLTFGARYGGHYGTGCLRKQYPAWYEKWMDHGAKRLLQLRMIKDAYIGDIFWYPPNMIVTLPDGTQLPWRDLMREMGENRLSGGAMTLPRVYDQSGKELTGYTPPQDIGGGSQIFDWVNVCDEGIMYGADVPMEVAKAADTGSGYSGRSIPFLVVLSVCTQELCEIVQCVDEQVLRPLAWLNFGGDPDYEITPRSLVESFSADTSGSSMGGGALGSTDGERPKQIEAGPPAASQYNEQFKERSGVEHVSVYGHPKLKVYRNPSHQQALDLLREHGELRGIHSHKTNDRWLWNAHAAEHDVIGDRIGVNSYDGHHSRLKFDSDSISFLHHHFGPRSSQHEESLDDALQYSEISNNDYARAGRVILLQRNKDPDTYSYSEHVSIGKSSIRRLGEAALLQLSKVLPVRSAEDAQREAGVAFEEALDDALEAGPPAASQHSEFDVVDPAHVGMMGPKFAVHKNPSIHKIKTLLKNSKHKELKGIRSTNGDYHVWDAHHAHHEHVTEMLGYNWHSDILHGGERVHFKDHGDGEVNKYTFHKLTGQHQHEEAADVVLGSDVQLPLKTRYVVRLKDGRHVSVKAKTAKHAKRRAASLGHDVDRVLKPKQYSEQFGEYGSHTRLPSGTVVHHNPTPPKVRDLVKKHGVLRGYIEPNGNHHVWDAKSHVHSDVIGKFGIGKHDSYEKAKEGDRLTHIGWNVAHEVASHFEKAELQHDHSQHDEQFKESKFSSTQFNLSPELCSTIRVLQEQIDRNDLQPTDYGDESDTGLECNSHVTVLYGLHTDNGEELRALVSGFGPIAIQLGDCSVFHADMSTPPDPNKPKYDVLKIDVISQGLHDLHNALKEHFEHTSTHPEYKPHATIAYVKPGMGEHYAIKLNLLKGKTCTFDRLIFSDKNRNHLSLPLCGQATFQEGGTSPSDLTFPDSIQ